MQFSFTFFHGKNILHLESGSEDLGLYTSCVSMQLAPFETRHFTVPSYERPEAFSVFTAETGALTRKD